MMNQGGMIWLIGVYSVIALLLLSRVVRVFFNKHNKVTEEEVQDILHSPFIPKVSLIIPGYCIPTIERVFSLMSLQYGNYELVITLDKGDPLIQELKKEFLLKKEQPKPDIVQVKYQKIVFRSDRPGFRKLLVVEKQKDSLSSSINAALNICTGQYICVLIRPAFICRDALIKLLKPFMEKEGALTASAGAVRVRPVDITSAPYALRTIRNFILHGTGWSPVVAIEAFCEGLGMITRKDVMILGGFSDTKDPVRSMLYKLIALQIESKKKPAFEYIPEVLVQADEISGIQYGIPDQFRSYKEILKKKFNIKKALYILPVIFPGLPYFLLVTLMIFLMIAGPWSGNVSVLGSISYFMAGYTFLVASSLLALFIEIRFSSLKYSSKEIRVLIAASFILPFRIHFPGRG